MTSTVEQLKSKIKTRTGKDLAFKTILIGFFSSLMSSLLKDERSTLVTRP